MNFVSKFDGSLSVTGVHPKAQTHTETVSTKAPADAILVKDADLLFNGDFKRTGTDLVISKDGQELVLSDYFKGDKRALASSDGAYLTGKIVDALTGHVQVAQADGSAAAAKVIGHVTKLTGNATVIRNGVSIILNNGDNVHQGDVVQCGSNSTLGITFIDGSVFGLGANAKMVLNEMVYDPNGSNNSALLSLVSGTISFVAGATAKHGDMKVDTPVATMGIRGTAVLVEIDFEVTAPGSAPPARFQVLVEPDGTTGSYVLLDRLTLAPIANVNQAGTVTTVSGQGTVSFLASAQLSPEAMKLINEVFSQRFTDNANPKSDTHFTDTLVPQTTFVKFANGETGTITIHVGTPLEKTSGPSGGPPATKDHIPGPPDIHAFNGVLSEQLHLTGSSLIDKVSSQISYFDINPGDVPTASAAFHHFAYSNAHGTDVTALLTATQRAAIDAVSVPLVITQDPAGKNFGAATWTYSVQDGALDFLADGETLTLTYRARVDNNFAPSNEFSFANFTITITGTNDVPTVSVTSNSFTEQENASQPNPTGSIALDTVTGTITFADVDLTDTHAVTIESVSASGVTTGVPDYTTMFGWLSLGALTDSTYGVTGSTQWTFTAEDHYFDYLAEDETVTFTYTIEVNDHHGGVVTKPVTVTVTGTNDTPDVTTTNNAFKEQADTTGSTAFDTVKGTISFTDADLSDTHAVTIKSVSASGVTAGVPDYTTMFNWLSLGALTDSTGGVTGSTEWTFTAQDYYFDYLAEDETVTFTYTIEVDDHHGGLVTKEVAVTVTGSNDAPVAVADSDTGHIVESGNDAANNFVPGVDTTSGNVLANDTDVDLSDTHEVVGVAAGTQTGVLSTGVGTTITGTYGDLVLNANGTWSYHLRNDYQATNALAQDAHASDIFSYTESDHHGGTSTTTLTIDITGTNDGPITNVAPVATTDVNEGAPVVERGVHPGNTEFAGVDTAAGNVLANDFDVDTGDSKTVQGVASGTPSGPLTGQVATSVDGTYGHVTIAADGAWTYILDNDRAATQALTQDQHVFDVFTYTMRDALGSTSSATLTIDVFGTNDAPVAAADAFTLNSNDTSLANNVLTNDTDVDNASLSVSGVTGATQSGASYIINGTYGELTVNADGSFTYVLGSQLDQNDPVHAAQAAAYHALADGATADDAFGYTASDGQATSNSTLTLTVTGSAAPAPVIDTEHFEVSSNGNNEPTTVTGLFVTDLNAAETLTLTATTAEAAAGSTITPSSGSGVLADINSAIASVTYDPGATPPLTDMITLAVSGASGTDTVHFVFNQAGNGPGITLQGTNGKDIIFATESDDTLTGDAGHDQFVFSPLSSGSVQHTITDFETLADKIDIRQFAAINSLADISAVQQGSDTLVTLDGHDSILLQNVVATNLNAGNFIFHA